MVLRLRMLTQHAVCSKTKKRNPGFLLEHGWLATHVKHAATERRCDDDAASVLALAHSGHIPHRAPDAYERRGAALVLMQVS